MTALIQTIDTADGPFTILVDEHQRVLASGWTADHDEIVGRLAEKNRPAEVRDGTTDAASAVRAYYDGDLSAIDDVPVRQFGTEMQRAGWDALRRVTPGQPLTYTEFAVALGSPSAVRAAASICARNAPALFVPCHRVLRGDGSMGGFAWGVDVKESLLARERAAR
ncbi:MULTISPECIES: methylated-DNA--[protein]-cysteine S-methyltransferase [unclassified Microbacterium]|uniref:methylated-DNA--[protein]-cysteine S-methyltransferase n=1 Tax=unclassified Microbacterium TaxID=2609290 RepID=UPI001DA92A80|nr:MULTISPECIES: methylated-DNA--[protein]-cysteine S-methyltransferase [unclassified Microbacterium]CAH0125758.1 Methylated-DNA--protein-cysteine methyltransferase [Microbacterium sp. Bi121]HWK78006.1 methylated-DNA--[protein]-cysteine S-methyltransferase [Microbacterium sp.]